MRFYFLAFCLGLAYSCVVLGAWRQVELTGKFDDSSYSYSTSYDGVEFISSQPSSNVLTVEASTFPPTRWRIELGEALVLEAGGHTWRLKKTFTDDWNIINAASAFIWKLKSCSLGDVKIYNSAARTPYSYLEMKPVTYQSGAGGALESSSSFLFSSSSSSINPIKLQSRAFILGFEDDRISAQEAILIAFLATTGVFSDNVSRRSPIRGSRRSSAGHLSSADFTGICDNISNEGQSHSVSLSHKIPAIRERVKQKFARSAQLQRLEARVSSAGTLERSSRPPIVLISTQDGSMTDKQSRSFDFPRLAEFQQASRVQGGGPIRSARPSADGLFAQPSRFSLSGHSNIQSNQQEIGGGFFNTPDSVMRQNPFLSLKTANLIARMGGGGVSQYSYQPSSVAHLSQGIDSHLLEFSEDDPSRFPGASALNPDWVKSWDVPHRDDGDEEGEGSLSSFSPYFQPRVRSRILLPDSQQSDRVDALGGGGGPLSTVRETSQRPTTSTPVERVGCHLGWLTCLFGAKVKHGGNSLW